MSIVKELRSVDLSSFTIMLTGISVLYSIIFSIIMTIIIGITEPSSIGVALYLISTIIVGTFMYTIYNSFCGGFLYNTLSTKINNINIALKDEKEIIKVSTTGTAIILAMILTIQAILLYLVSVFLLPLLISSAVQTLMLSGQQALGYSLYQFLMVLSQPTTVALIIFGTFIVTFVFVLLGCYIYNILASYGRGIILNLSKEDNLTAIDSIDVLKLAVVFAVVAGILNLVLSLISLISGGDFISALGNVIGGFIGAFVSGALFAIFYNFLAPKLGKIKLELIDQ